MPEMALRVSSLLLTEERKLPFRDVWVDWGIFFLHDSGEKTRVFCIFESGGDFGDFGEGTGPVAINGPTTSQNSRRRPNF